MKGEPLLAQPAAASGAVSRYSTRRLGKPLETVGRKVLEAVGSGKRFDLFDTMPVRLPDPLRPKKAKKERRK